MASGIIRLVVANVQKATYRGEVIAGSLFLLQASKSSVEFEDYVNSFQAPSSSSTSVATGKSSSKGAQKSSSSATTMSLWEGFSLFIDSLTKSARVIEKLGEGDAISFLDIAAIIIRGGAPLANSKSGTNSSKEAALVLESNLADMTLQLLCFHKDINVRRHAGTLSTGIVGFGKPGAATLWSNAITFLSRECARVREGVGKEDEDPQSSDSLRCSCISLVHLITKMVLAPEQTLASQSAAEIAFDTESVNLSMVAMAIFEATIPLQLDIDKHTGTRMGGAMLPGTAEGFSAWHWCCSQWTRLQNQTIDAQGNDVECALRNSINHMIRDDGPVMGSDGRERVVAMTAMTALVDLMSIASLSYATKQIAILGEPDSILSLSEREAAIYRFAIWFCGIKRRNFAFLI